MTESAADLVARFQVGLARSRDLPALRMPDGELTYAAVHRLARTWAAAILGERTRGRGGPVAVLAGRSAVGYVGRLACLYAGVAVVPITPGLPAERVRTMIAQSGASVVLVDEPGGAALADVVDGGPPPRVLAPGCADRVPGTLDAREPDPGRVLDRPVGVHPDDPAYLLFTSGSTGRPKGVPISHANLCEYLRHIDARYDFTAADVFSQTFDLNFDCALFDLFVAWGAGATVVTVPPAAYRDLAAFVADQGITVWFSTPSAIALGVRTGSLRPGRLPALRWSLFAGEALLADQVRAWARAAPSSLIENIYGPTELTVTVSAYRWEPEVSPGRCVNGIVPIGGVHDGHAWRLVAEDGADDPVEGELLIAGPQLTAGYLDAADGAGRFVDRDGLRWYRTGDWARVMDDGGLAYLGRRDDQVQVQGIRVELSEIDHAFRAVPGVEEAVTVATTEPDGGTGLVVFYTGRPVPLPELMRGARAALPPGLLPRSARHVDAMPLNSNRKVDRRSLRALLPS